MRNGVEHGYALFPFSDIDLTILVSDLTIKDDLRKFLRTSKFSGTINV